jgi:large subunit ribosomal protein L9
MKVLLTKDVYKLGRAGDIKKVADGYGRNFLLPQGLAVLATAGALRQVDRIKSQADIRRTEQNSELKDLASHINGVVLVFSAKAGDTGKLYGSITTQDVATAIQEKTRYEVKKQQIEMQPIRTLGDFIARVRLTMDLSRNSRSKCSPSAHLAILLRVSASPWTSFPKSRSSSTVMVKRLKKKRLPKRPLLQPLKLLKPSPNSASHDITSSFPFGGVLVMFRLFTTSLR